MAASASKALAKCLLDRTPRLKHYLLDQYKLRSFQWKMSSLGKFFKKFRSPILFNNLDSLQLASKVFGVDRGSSVLYYYMQKFMERSEEHIQGRVLEVQESLFSRQFTHKDIQIDILHVEEGNPDATIVGDLTKASTLPENQFDCFICTSTFNHIFEIEKAIKTSHQLLKPGGVLIATMPCLAQIARYDMDRWGDYWRLTSKACEQLFTPVFGEGNVELITYGNVLAAITEFQGISTEELPNPKLLDEFQKDYEVMTGIIARKAL
ncbi:MAG: methyltransferase domain-containing protein [Planctomycetes bacterium]|nr:methyltransferase domain-containing protein [Planctomycetota bacterium]